MTLSALPSLHSEVDCDGEKMYGVGGMSKAVGTKTYYYFCHCCGKLLEEKHLQRDGKKLAERIARELEEA